MTKYRSTMTPERFRQLADAYGAEPHRWPEAERAQALAYLAERGQAAERELFDARLIDLALDASPQPKVPDGLRAAVLAAGAALPVRRPSVLAELFGGRPAWLPGVGLLTACALGVVVGLELTSVATRDLAADAAYSTAALLGEDLEVWG